MKNYMLKKGNDEMIKYIKGDLFNSPAKILVNTVNTVGVMGKGVALEFKRRYPEMFYRYKQLCEKQCLDVGTLYLWRKEKKWVLLFPTKKNWRNPSKLEYIEMGLKKLVENWDKLGADSIAFPRLGCGNGGLDWNDVRPLMEKYLKNLPLNIYIYVDNYEDPKPEHMQISEIEKWLNGFENVEGYEKFKLQLEDILKNDKSIFLDDKIQAEVKDTGELQIQYDNEDCVVKDEELCSFWNYVRDVGIVDKDEVPSEYEKFSDVVLKLMKKMDYVQAVIVSNNGASFAAQANAYQFVAE